MDPLRNVDSYPAALKMLTSFGPDAPKAFPHLSEALLPMTLKQKGKIALSFIAIIVSLLLAYYLTTQTCFRKTHLFVFGSGAVFVSSLMHLVRKIISSREFTREMSLKEVGLNNNPLLEMLLIKDRCHLMTLNTHRAF